MQHIVFIGNDLARKRVTEFVRMAGRFPQLQFHIVGGDRIGDLPLSAYLRDHPTDNIVYHGLLDHTRLAALLADMQLMFFPSRSEGFPKVMLETASAGVPTLCYDDYGAQEWISSGRNGFVVHTFDEACAVIQELLDHPERLHALSQHATELGRRFDWRVLVKTWEQEIERIATT